MGMYVQYGCGLCAPDGWLNFDASPALRIRKIPLIGKSLSKIPFPDAAMFGDILEGLPLADGSADGVYCSHTLEHLALDDCRRALRNSLKLLKPGGVFRFVLPNLKEMAAEYMANPSAEAATQFVDRTGMGRKVRLRGLSGMVRTFVGNSPHLWMWDYPALEVELKNAGFSEIRPAQRGDSGDEMFTRAEVPERWENALGMQCRRPG